MRSLALLLVFTTLSCRTAKLIPTDVVEVGKAPVREWKKTVAATATVGAALLLDDEIARIVRNNDSAFLDKATDLVEPLGGAASDKFIAALFLYGCAAKDDRARTASFDALVSSLLASKVITPALKQVIHKERPNGGDDESFPSNHATEAFAVASVLAVRYEHRPWVAPAAYGIASGVAFARVYHEAHWTSDVLAGAAIGALVGTTVARTNERERARWTITPMVTGDGFGIMVRHR